MVESRDPRIRKGHRPCDNHNGVPCPLEVAAVSSEFSTCHKLGRLQQATAKGDNGPSTLAATQLLPAHEWRHPSYPSKSLLGTAEHVLSPCPKSGTSLTLCLRPGAQCQAGSLRRLAGWLKRNDSHRGALALAAQRLCDGEPLSAISSISWRPFTQTILGDHWLKPIVDTDYLASDS